MLVWESFEHSTVLVDSEERNSFTAGMGHVFDLEVAAPLTRMALPRSASDMRS